MSVRVVLTVAALTLQEAARRRVLRSLAVLTVVLLALSGWGFSKIPGLDAERGDLTSGESWLVASIMRGACVGSLDTSHPVGGRP